MNKLHIVNIAVKGAKQLTTEARKLMDNLVFLNNRIEYYNSYLQDNDLESTAIKDTLENMNIIPIYESLQLIPTKAFSNIPYGVDQNFKIEAVSSDVDGENIIITFVNPLDVSQSLSVAYDSESNLVTITHSTSAGTELTITNIDGTGTEATATCVEHGLSDGDYVKITGTTSYDGVYEVLAPTLDTFTFLSAIDTLAESGTGYTIEINTAAGSLETLINTDEIVSTIISGEMGTAGTIIFEGTVQLDGYLYGRVMNAGESFIYGENLYIAVNDVDGILNETTDFRKIALSSI